jgi:DNA-binding transcriptional LysR family regulator
LTNLNDLTVFERVAVLESFTDAGRALRLPKSTVSRCVARLETQLGVRLIQRNTHSIRLTPSGIVLKERCTAILTRVSEAIDFVTSLNAVATGTLNIGATIGFSYFVLSELLPAFLKCHPSIKVSLNLTAQPEDVVARGIDVAIRMGELPDSRLVATSLGTMQRYLCASPSYLEHRGMPLSIRDLRQHDTIGSVDRNGIPRIWRFYKHGREIGRHEDLPNLLVNDPGMIYQFVLKDAGIGAVPGYLSAPDIKAGRLTQIFPQWTMPPTRVSLVYASSRGLSPAVRAFVAHMKQTAAAGTLWLDDPLEKRTLPLKHTRPSKKRP